MTTQELQEKLKTHSPRLLSCKEAGISEGWEYAGRTNGRGEVVFHKDGELPQTRICLVSGETARFIAATNGEYPPYELLWDAYMRMNQPSGWALEALLSLSAANRLGWVEKGEGAFNPTQAAIDSSNTDPQQV